MNIGKQMKRGLLTENPAAVGLLGLSTALAVTTSLSGGLGLGLCALAVLVLSNTILSALGPYLPKGTHTVSAVIITATLSGVADLVVQAFLPSLAGDLGLYLPLLAATCVLLNGAGAFAYANTVALSALEGLFRGLGYALVLILTGIIRELLGKGSFGEGLLNGGRGLRVFPARFAAGGMVHPVGGFLALACVVALVQFLSARRPGKRKEGTKG